MFKHGCWLFLVGFVSFGGVFADDSQNIDYPTLNSSWAYCFEYTWMGPEYTEITGYNGTCDDYKDDTRAGDDIPCAPPLVISTDGTIPDIQYLWDKHRASVLCRRAENQACVTYTYSYNGLITNQTHMCARIYSDSGSAPTVCYKQTMEGFDVELCICKSRNGLNIPCNSDANTYSLSISAILVALLIKWGAYLF